VKISYKLADSFLKLHVGGIIATPVLAHVGKLREKVVLEVGEFNFMVVGIE
jgi:hypothetical protein